MKKKRVVLILVPHPDDGEFFASEFCFQAIEAGYEVHELIACCDEYGTPRNEFKGKKIQRIRRLEMIKSAKVYGVDSRGEPLLKLHWADYLDGYVPYSQDSIRRFQNFIEKLHPDIILGPDPFIFFDGHCDHLATGMNYYTALHRINPSKRPKIMLYYQSLNPNIFLSQHHKKDGFRAWSAHVSQRSLIVDIFYHIKHLLYTASLIRYHAGFIAEGYRTIDFQNKKGHPNNGAKFVFRFFFSSGGWGDRDRNLFTPVPEKLGLNVNPLHEII